MTHFILIFALLQWSGTEPTKISLRYACTEISTYYTPVDHSMKQKCSIIANCTWFFFYYYPLPELFAHQYSLKSKTTGSPNKNWKGGHCLAL